MAILAVSSRLAGLCTGRAYPCTDILRRPLPVNPEPGLRRIAGGGIAQLADGPSRHDLCEASDGRIEPGLDHRRQHFLGLVKGQLPVQA